MRHDFADGKYTVINDKGTLTALRHGEPWARDLVGDNLVYWMLVEVDRLKAEIEAGAAERAIDPDPIDMVLHCPSCHAQHIDAPDSDLTARAIVGPAAAAVWRNPPHRSHLCHSCGTIWRPADVCTNGVARIATRGTNDTWGPAC